MTNAMIQKLGNHVFDNHFHNVGPEPDDYMLHYAPYASHVGADSAVVMMDGMLAREEEGQLVLPKLRDYQTKPEYVYLFAIDDMRFFLALDVVVNVGDEFTYLGLNGCRFYTPRYLAFAAITGYQLWDWHKHNRFCGACGTKLLHAPKSRELVCPNCGMIVYPRINIGVIIGITDGDKLLLTKYTGRSYTHYALVAGYTEVGETLEQTCEREIMEEVGLHVKDLTYFTDQPWSFSGTLLIGYFARLDGGSQIKLDHHELAVAEWKTRSELPKTHEDTSSMTNYMIEAFAKGEDPFSQGR